MVSLGSVLAAVSQRSANQTVRPLALSICESRAGAAVVLVRFENVSGNCRFSLPFFRNFTSSRSRTSFTPPVDDLSAESFGAYLAVYPVILSRCMRRVSVALTTADC